jgi:hypothetical protein
MVLSLAPGRPIVGKSSGTLIRGNIIGKGTRSEILAAGAVVEGTQAAAL